MDGPLYGPVATSKLPQQNGQQVRMLAEWFLRSSTALRDWATAAKECIDFMEGRQWSKEQIAQLAAEGRPALQFNKIAPLVRLVVGYQRNNQIDTRFLPSSDEISSEQTAEVLGMLWKQYAQNTDLEYVDGEVFMDGIVGARGYYDTRLDFTENEQGQIRTKALDPFSVYPDPDAMDYDLENCQYIQTSRWTSLDEVEFTWGKDAVKLLQSLVRNDGFVEFPTNYWYTEGEITPLRRFGGESSDSTEWWSLFQERWVDFVDPFRKNIRMIDSQYKIRRIVPCFVDLETGEFEPVPHDFSQVDIDKVMFHGERTGNPLKIIRRPVKRVRWTVQVGDLIVHDDWSPYDHFTIDGYFPYFRRGQTRGMVDDLIDPQKEVNKRRSAQIDIVTRTTNSGWMHHENSLDPEQEANLDMFGASPGIRVKWKGDKAMKPEKINPSPPPTSMERLELSANNDMREISGINPSALGEIDRVQSGRAIEARQRQAVISIQAYMDNFSRTKKLQGKKFLDIVQEHYTESRIVRVLGEEGKLVKNIINKQLVNDVGEILGMINDITVGKYVVTVDERPMSATFRNAQFEEAMEIMEKLAPMIGPVAPALADIVVDMSSLPNKDAIKSRIQQALGAAAQQGVGTAAPGAGAAGVAQPPGGAI